MSRYQGDYNERNVKRRDLRDNSMIRERLAWELSTQPKTARIPHMTKAPLSTQKLKSAEGDGESKVRLRKCSGRLYRKLSIAAVDSDPNSHKILFPITVIYSMLRVSAVDKTCSRNFK